MGQFFAHRQKLGTLQVLRMTQNENLIMGRGYIDFYFMKCSKNIENAIADLSLVFFQQFGLLRDLLNLILSGPKII